MLLERCTAQKSATIDAFYQVHDAPLMLSLIARLRACAWPDRAWALTSHLHLVLLAEDDDAGPWLIKLIAQDSRCYYVEFLMPPRNAPWPGAYVGGVASSEDEAMRYVEQAFRLSEGWGAPPHG